MQEFKEKGDEVHKEGIRLFAVKPDQRYTVINAIAKRDPCWARKLIDQMLAESANEAKEATGKKGEDFATADKLLALAVALMDSDQTAALNFARSSFSYPATFYLEIFLYKLAGLTNRRLINFIKPRSRSMQTVPSTAFSFCRPILLECTMT